MEKNQKKSRLIGAILVEQGIISPDQLKEALKIQAEKKGYICSIIIRSGFAKTGDVFRVLAQELAMEYVDLKKEDVDPKAVEKVPVKLALHYKLMPYKLEGNKLTVALADPLDVSKLDDLRIFLDIDIEAALSYEGDILEGIHKHYGVGAATLDELMAKPETKENIKARASTIEDLEGAVEEASLAKFVNQILTQAAEERATDIHFEPFENELRVRFRIDGVLYEVPIPESIKLFHQQIISRIKIMSNLDIAERRFPQDGRIKIKIKEQDLDLRVSIVPSSFGESAQIRILSLASFLRLENLGLLDNDLNIIEAFINNPYGVIFVTGPTGSGKSTTLYACLSKKNTPGIKIITVEDPIEHQVRGITQIQIHPKIGLNFAECLRYILRHDPDLIMIGEVRDAETAEIAVRSAMTGHLVFSTLHTNDAASTVTRLLDMGMEPFLLASSLECLIAQRLVRILCPKCKEKVKPDQKVLDKITDFTFQPGVEIYENRGCKLCRFTGFKGRTGIYEIIKVSDSIRKLILDKSSSQQIKEKAILEGARTLRQDGFQKVLMGVTTISEVLRVTREV